MKPLDYKPYPRFTLESYRTTGGGGGQTGEMGMLSKLWFCFGNDTSGETGGWIGFKWEDMQCRVLEIGYHFADASFHSHDVESKLFRAGQFVIALQTAFRGCHRIFHISGNREDTSDSVDSMLSALGVEVVFQKDIVSVGSPDPSMPKIFARRMTTETTSVSTYDVFNDKLETLIIIPTKNLEVDLTEILRVIRKNRCAMLNLVANYPSFPEQLDEKDQIAMNFFSNKIFLNR